MIRIVVGVPGPDRGPDPSPDPSTDRGMEIIARALRDAGHEVIHAGVHQNPEQIVETAIQEDADLIALSVPRGEHLTWFARVVGALAERAASDIEVFGLGSVPDQDVADLEEMGIARVFTPGATTGEITGWVAEHFKEPS